jgi:putative acetyltransferase
VRAEQDVARIPERLVSRPYELREEAFAERICALESTGRYVVAEKGSKVVGHALLDPMGLEAIRHVFRLTIVVHSGYEGKGIGRALMEDLIAWAQQDVRVGKIELLVRATNERAIALYRAFEFAEEGRFRKRVRMPNDTFVDDIAMAWIPIR